MMEVILPCGDSLISKTDMQTGERRYYLNGELIWEPKKTHRVALMQAILMEDNIKYNALREMI